MRKSYIIILGSAMLLISQASWGQSVLSPRTAIIVGENNAKKAKGADGVDNKVTAFVTIDTNVTSWDELGIKPINKDGKTTTVRLSLNEINALAKKQGVEYVQITSKVIPTLDVAREETGMNDVHNGVSLLQPYTGKGVVVGVVDSGFDYLHSAFRNPKDGSLRIKRVWEQNGTASLSGAKAPEKFGYGIELNTPELISASIADAQNFSHGSHVTGIAAGSDDYENGKYVGNAPDADIVLVAFDTSKSSSADICNGVQYIFDYADEVGKPCVVNLSLANHDGPHDGTSTFDTMTDQMQKAGRLIVGAAGNFRKDKFHIDHTFSSADDKPLNTFVKFKLNTATYPGGVIDIWGEKDSEFSVELSAYNLLNGSKAEATTVYPAEGVSEVKLNRYTTGSWKVASEISPLNGKPHVVLTSEIKSVRNNYAILLTVTPKKAGRVNVWADDSYLGLESKDIEGMSEPDASSSTLGEIGGTGNKILTVGAYTTRVDFTTPTYKATINETLNDLSSFSAYGPTTDGRIKPEVTAPGCLVISAVSNYDKSDDLVLAEEYTKNGRNNIYAYMQGTSMSSPFVAGVVATWLQAYPQLTPEQLHEIIQTTSRKDNFTSVEADNNWGYGKINPMEGLKKCIDLQTSGCVAVDSPFDGSVKVVDNNVVIGFVRDTKASVVITDLAGNIILSKDLGRKSGGEYATVQMPESRKGVYVLSVKTGTSINSFKYVVK